MCFACLNIKKPCTIYNIAVLQINPLNNDCDVTIDADGSSNTQIEPPLLVPLKDFHTDVTASYCTTTAPASSRYEYIHLSYTHPGQKKNHFKIEEKILTLIKFCVLSMKLLR